MLGYTRRLPLRRKPLVEEIHQIIENKPSWGCEMVREILGNKGIPVSRNRMHRLWKAEKLQVSQGKTRRKFRTGARLNPVPTSPNSVWCTDFAEDRAGGRKMFVFLVKDEVTGILSNDQGAFIMEAWMFGPRRIVWQPYTVSPDPSAITTAASTSRVPWWAG